MARKTEISSRWPALHFVSFTSLFCAGSAVGEAVPQKADQGRESGRRGVARPVSVSWRRGVGSLACVAAAPRRPATVLHASSLVFSSLALSTLARASLCLPRRILHARR